VSIKNGINYGDIKRNGYSSKQFFSPSSYLYLCRIATSYAAIANRPYAYALSLCLRRVSFATQKGLAYLQNIKKKKKKKKKNYFEMIYTPDSELTSEQLKAEHEASKRLSH
jgi:hypothetical protein